MYHRKVDELVLHQVNLIRTSSLLEVPTTTQSVLALLTSTSSIHLNSTASFKTEEAPLATRGIAFTKALADNTVLEADFSNLRTLRLHTSAIYGERDTQLIPGSLAVTYDKQNHIQLSDKKDLYDAICLGTTASVLQRPS